MMERQTINDIFTLQIPDGFEVLTEEDLRSMYKNVGDPFNWGVRDMERHASIVAIWKKYPALLSWTLDPAGRRRRSERVSLLL